MDNPQTFTASATSVVNNLDSGYQQTPPPEKGWNQADVFPNQPMDDGAEPRQTTATQQHPAEAYCNEVLKNVREINAQTQNPQAFSTILTTIGFLSALCCTVADRRSDREKFICFILRWMPTDYHPMAEDLYHVVRCGLVHAMTIANKPNQKAFALTHDAPESKHLLQEQVNGIGRQILVASKLCDDIGTAIGKMFADPGTRMTIEKNFMDKPPIDAYEVKL